MTTNQSVFIAELLGEPGTNPHDRWELLKICESEKQHSRRPLLPSKRMLVQEIAMRSRRPSKEPAAIVCDAK